MSELTWKDLFTEDDRLKTPVALSLLAEYEQDRTKACYVMTDLDWLVISKVFYVDEVMLHYNAYDKEFHFDVFSKNQCDWDLAIAEVRNEHKQWMELHQARILSLMNYSIEIPKSIANFILKLSYEDGEGEPDLVKIDSKKINSAFAISKKTRLVGCVNCAVYTQNFCWDLTKVTYKDLNEHLQSESHKNALNVPIDQELLTDWGIDDKQCEKALNMS